MTTKQTNPFPIGEILVAIILIAFLIMLNCSNAKAQTFNHRDFQEGNFKITYDTDSVYITEQFVYEEAGYKYNWKNSFSELVINICDGQMYKEIFTVNNKYIFLYCKGAFQICNVTVYPSIGEVLQYYNK